MNWQRGLLLAGINLVAVAPLILLLEARDARYVRDREQSGSDEGRHFWQSTSHHIGRMAASVPRQLVTFRNAPGRTRLGADPITPGFAEENRPGSRHYDRPSMVPRRVVPFRRPPKWWAEAGGFITACTVVGACFALIPAVDSVALLPATLSAFSWFLWFGLLVWVTIRFLWRQIARLPRPLAK